MAVSVLPFFLPTQKGALFMLHFSPEQPPVTQQWIIHLPAFAEEMNASRYSVSQQARAFAAQGFSVLIFDLSGTGDSEGDFAETHWEDWLHNVHTVVHWVTTKTPHKIHLWSLRTGVLLALDFLAKNTLNRLHTLLCWQPVFNAEPFILQFLRIKVTAALMDKKKSPLTTQTLIQQLKTGIPVEVAGYRLNPTLIQSMLQLKPFIQPLNALQRCIIVQINALENTLLKSSYQQWQQHCIQQGINAHIKMLDHPHFWNTGTEHIQDNELTTLSCQQLAAL